MSGRIWSVIAIGVMLVGGLPLAHAFVQHSVAQRVVLHEDDPNDPNGKKYTGSVTWRTEAIKANGKRPADIAVRADIEIPNRKFKMTMSFRRNSDATLPASYLMEIKFGLLPDLTRSVARVPDVLMKVSEQGHGTPLAGVAVKVIDGFFLFGLSNDGVDRTRDVQYLKKLAWFEIPLVYVDDRLARVTIEKGEPGRRAFENAFAAWGR